jgi:hypothetical protein
MTASIELLVVLMVVLLVTASGLIAYLLRAWRKNAVDKLVAESSSEHEMSGEVPAAPQMLEGGAADVPGERVAVMQSQAEPAEPVQPMPVRETTSVVGQPEVIREPSAVLLMQVWQDSEGYLVVEADGQRYRRLFDIRDGEVGRRVLEAINRLVAFSKGKESRVASLAPPQKPAARPAAPSPPAAAVDKETRAFFDEVRQKEETPRKVSRIVTDPVPFRRSSPTQQPGITLNLAEEIDRILQIRITAAPEFSGRRIHVVTAPDGTLRFQVEGISHAALDEIPDPQVQALIRAAIADWEARR